jgi:hypothetical protein
MKAITSYLSTMLVGISMLFAININTLNAQVYNRMPITYRQKKVCKPVIPHARYMGLPAQQSFHTKLPVQAVKVTQREEFLYYHNGIYYKPVNSGYLIVQPLSGTQIHSLPAGHIKVKMGTRNYYYYYGTFYIEDEDCYVSVEPPHGIKIDALPEGYKTIKIDGKYYYLLNGVYYKAVQKSNGSLTFEVVS